MSQLIHPKLSYELTGICLRIHKELGRFARERQYADRFEEILTEKQLPYQREVNIKVVVNNESPQGNRADFIIDNKVLLDFKAKKFVTKEDYFQMQRYLKSARLKLGLIVNFHNSYLKPKRIINPDYDTNL